MNITLSPRLLTCCNFICPGDRVADVGTDHGYLGIWLLQQGLASSVIASDIAPGPLSAAERTSPTVCRIFPEILMCWSAPAWAATPSSPFWALPTG